MHYTCQTLSEVLETPSWDHLALGVKVHCPFLVLFFKLSPTCTSSLHLFLWRMEEEMSTRDLLRGHGAWEQALLGAAYGSYPAGIFWQQRRHAGGDGPKACFFFFLFFFFLLNFVDLLSRQAVGGKVLTVNCFPLALNCWAAGEGGWNGRFSFTYSRLRFAMLFFFSPVKN